jgi:hypothetical protein
MTKKIFVSYSSPDKDKADAICRALEGAGMSCWIAPRDLSAGTQWGGGIAKAIEECEAVAVVFSSAANNSPQVAREMELAVSKRRPLVPIRVADDQPTDDMQYFLGVSHWFNAYQQPIDTYLPDIVMAIRRVLTEQRRPWTRISARLPRSRPGMILTAAAGAVLLAVLVAWMMRPRFPNTNEAPLAGRWETSIPDGKGGKMDCTADIQKNTLITYSDSCPSPLMGSSGSINTVDQGFYAPSLYRSGDSGTYMLAGGTANGDIGAYKLGWFGGLTTRDDKFGELHWKKIAQDGPMKSGMDGILPQPASWPLKDMPGVANRSIAYVRSKWLPDAQLMSIDVKLLKSNEAGVINVNTDQGGLELRMGFYSPQTQQGLTFWPMSKGTSLSPSGVIDTNGDKPLPADFVDLPAAVEAIKGNGMRAKQIYEAQLKDWGPDSSAGGTRLHGIEWMIDSTLDERFVVPATK